MSNYLCNMRHSEPRNSDPDPNLIVQAWIRDNEYESSSSLFACINISPNLLKDRFHSIFHFASIIQEQFFSR